MKNNNKNVLFIPKEELRDPEKLLFTAKVPVKFLVRSAKTIKSQKEPIIDIVVLELVVLEGKDKGKVHTLFIRKDMKNQYAKKNYISFVKAFFTVDEISSGKANLSKIINHNIEVVFGIAKEYKGNMYQNAYAYTDLGEASTDNNVDINMTPTIDTSNTVAMSDEEPIF